MSATEDRAITSPQGEESRAERRRRIRQEIAELDQRAQKALDEGERALVRLEVLRELAGR